MTEIVSQICGIPKKQILNFRNEAIGYAFLKRRRKFFQLDYFDQQALSRPTLGFYREPTPKMITIDRILAKCKSIHGFPYPCKSILQKWFGKLGLYYKSREIEIQLNQGCDITT